MSYGREPPALKIAHGTCMTHTYMTGYRKAARPDNGVIGYRRKRSLVTRHLTLPSFDVTSRVKSFAFI